MTRSRHASGRRPRKRRFFLALLGVAVLVYLGYCIPWWGSGWPLRGDEQVVIFTTAAHVSDDGQSYIVPIHGWVFEPDEDKLLRRATVAAVRASLDLDEGSPESTVLEQRLRWFLVDNQRGKRVVLRVGDIEQSFGPTDAQGHFEGSMLVPIEVAEKASKDAVLRLEVVSSAYPPGTFVGQALLVDRAGLSVLSDIDDTIKLSNVLDKKALLRNTLLKDFVAVPGMAELYRRFAEHGASFHYVSCGPWQLYEPLTTFLRDTGFPAAVLSLKRFRLKDSSVLELMADPRKVKPPSIEATLAAFPGRRFCLIGDSGEKDPEIYGDTARKHPERIACIYIRNVTGETRDSARMREATRELDPGLWRLFTDPTELPIPEAPQARAP